jgi:S-formylglutathione hydrolase FrmB
VRARAGIALLAAAAVLGLPAGSASAATRAKASPAAPTFKSVDGLTVVSQKSLDSRLIALTVKTSALPGPANIRILLPAGYAQHPHTSYPVLYLLHGTSGGASDWTTMGGAEQTTARLPMIVVMPDIALNDDGGGWCTNWPDGKYHWLTFHIDQLIPWVQTNLRTLNSRGERAIAGLSQGGFCSMSYASQFPDLFGVALAYSGAPDIAWDPVAHVGAQGIINATEVGLDGVPANSMFGDPTTDFFNWADHDPATLAPNLRWTKLYMYYGNGLPGPYDTNPINPGAEAIEALVSEDNMYFDSRLNSLGIKPVVYDPYGNGTHSWPYWARDLRWSIGDIMSDFEHPAPNPASFSYESGQPSYTIYGWQVTMQRKVAEFSTLSPTGTTAFALAGSGSGTVTTPTVYDPFTNYRVTIRSASKTTTQTYDTGSGRTLTVVVPLGPSDTVQEYTGAQPPAASPGTTVYTTQVTITKVKHKKKKKTHGRHHS